MKGGLNTVPANNVYVEIWAKGNRVAPPTPTLPALKTDVMASAAAATP